MKYKVFYRVIDPTSEQRTTVRSWVVLLAMLTASAVTGQGIDFLHEGWEKIKAQAAADDKIIFVDAYTTWCGPCKWMAAEVFTDPEVAEFYNSNFINVQLDMEKGEGIDFLAEYYVTAFPTLFFIDGQGEIVHKRVGAIPADMFLAFGKEALDPTQRIGSLMQRYRAGERDPDFLYTYTTKMLEAGMGASEAAEAYFATTTPQTFVSARNFALIRMLQPDMTDLRFLLVAEHHAAFSRQVGEEAVNAFIRDVCNGHVMRALYYDGDAAFADAIERVRDLHLDFLDEVITFGYMHQARKNDDYEQYIANTWKYVKRYAWDDWNVLNTFAWEIYEDTSYDDRAYLQLGEKMARRSVKLEENYYNTDTYAALLYRQGRLRPALNWALRAVELAKAEEVEFEETAALLEKIRDGM